MSRISPVTARDELQAQYNDLLALQDQTDQVPLAKALDAVGLALSVLGHAQCSPERIAELQYEAGMYKSLYENAIKQCAQIAEQNYALMFTKQENRDTARKVAGQISKGIRALADTSTDWLAKMHGYDDAAATALREQAFKTAELLEAADTSFDWDFRQFMAKQLRAALSDASPIREPGK